MASKLGTVLEEDKCGDAKDAKTVRNAVRAESRVEFESCKCGNTTLLCGQGCQKMLGHAVGRAPGSEKPNGDTPGLGNERVDSVGGEDGNWKRKSKRLDSTWVS